MEHYIVSARKYRPITFESVVGQRSLTDMLRNAIRTNHLAHAYLFCGPRGVGKTTCARIFARTINCSNLTADSDACNECPSCRAFNAQQSFNYHELDAASNNSVDDIRTLIQEVQIPPQDGKYSVFVIDEVHMLSTAAFNALLKTLEEPPAHAIFIMATTEKHKVLPTILSRCQVFDFSRITVADIISHLAYVAKTEGYEADESALAVVARKADGGMRDALSVFDQLATFCTDEQGHTKITYDKAINVLNVLDTDYYFRLVDMALNADVSSALLLLNEVLNKGFDGANFLAGFASHLRDVLVAKDPQTIILLETSESIRRQYAGQAAKCAAVWLFRVLDIVGSTEAAYRTARDKRLTLELMLIKLCRLLANDSQPQTGSQPQTVNRQPANAATQRVATAANSAQQATSATPASSKQPVASQPAASIKQPVANNIQRAPMQGMSAMPGIPTIPIPGGPAPTATPQPMVAQQPQQQETPQNAPFTEEQMAEAWRLMCKQLFAEDKINQALLSNIAIQKKDELTYEVQLPNKLLQQEITNNHLAKMHGFLRKTLRNTGVNIIIGLEEVQTEQVAYTAAEKMQVLLKLNPELSTLTSELGLIVQ